MAASRMIGLTQIVPIRNLTQSYSKLLQTFRRRQVVVLQSQPFFIVQTHFDHGLRNHSFIRSSTQMRIGRVFFLPCIGAKLGGSRLYVHYWI